MIPIKGEEFIKKVLDGERDFTGIELTDLDFANGQKDSFFSMCEYLKEQDLSQAPILLSESDLGSIQTEGLWLPYVKANNTFFRGARLSFANFQHGEFSRASFYKADLSQANCEGCDFYNAYFKEANFYQTRLGEARFKFANLAEVQSLDETIELVNALFERTHATSKEQEIIVKSLSEKEDFQDLDLEKLFRSQPTKPPE